MNCHCQCVPLDVELVVHVMVTLYRPVPNSNLIYSS